MSAPRFGGGTASATHRADRAHHRLGKSAEQFQIVGQENELADEQQQDTHGGQSDKRNGRANDIHERHFRMGQFQSLQDAACAQAERQKRNANHGAEEVDADGGFAGPVDLRETRDDVVKAAEENHSDEAVEGEVVPGDDGVGEIGDGSNRGHRHQRGNEAMDEIRESTEENKSQNGILLAHIAIACRTSRRTGEMPVPDIADHGDQKTNIRGRADGRHPLRNRSADEPGQPAEVSDEEKHPESERG